VPEIGLFPLQLVLLPTERVPLHIFEPRYKELIGECLEEGLEFGLVLEDEDGRRDVGTQAAVVEVAESDVDEPDPAANDLSFELASRVDFGHELKQEILELRSERRRLKRLVEILGRAVEAIALEKEVRERASGNGRVSPR